MAAATKDIRTNEQGDLEPIPGLGSLPVAASTTIYSGTIVASNASGYAVPATASSAFRAHGLAQEQVVNTGAAGAKLVRFRRGVFFLTNGSGANAFARADVGSNVYMSDDNIAQKTDGAGLNMYVGVMLPGGGTDNLGTGGDLGKVAVLVGAANPYQANPLIADEGSLAFTARNIAAAGNVASLAAFTVAGNDGVTNVAGDVVVLAEQTTVGENGPYVVGTVGGGTAPLTRPAWWSTGAVLPAGTEIKIGGEGTVFKNTNWKAMPAAETFIVGTDNPLLWPKQVSGLTALVAGTFTISTVPVKSTSSAVHLSRAVANTSAATDGGYHPTSGGATGITAGIRGTAAVIVQATVLAGTINNADISTLHWTIINSL